MDRIEAASYDRWFTTAWGRYAFAVEQAALLHAAAPLDGRRVLDAGCGTGRFTALLERHTPQVIGVDLDPAMLAVAATRVHAPVLIADATRLPFADAVFDRTVAVTLCEFVSDPARVVAELARVTRPGGRITIGSLNPRSPWGVAHHRQFRHPPWRTARFLTRRQLRALGRAHGRIRLHSALFAPGPVPGLHHIGPALELLGRGVCPALGAFQVLTIDKTQPMRRTPAPTGADQSWRNPHSQFTGDQRVRARQMRKSAPAPRARHHARTRRRRRS